tara:strand:- start:12986 stop:13645 length:660 start_codon:yes stop_codon:yes gene_type:complete
MSDQEDLIQHFVVEAEIKAMVDADDKGEFEGYAAIYGNVDLGNDMIEQGAFTKSIKKRGAKGVKMLFQHKTDMPIGVFDEIVEDQRGLRVKGRLAMETQLGREVYSLMKMGAIDGLSIGFKVAQKGYEYDKDNRRRKLKEVDVMEISAVTFPMNPKARITGVKQEKTVREWEGFLRDEGGLSRSEAKMGANALCKALGQRDVETELLDSIQNFTKILKG